MIGTDGILRREADHDQTSDTDSEKHESDSLPHKKIKVDILEEKNETDQGKNYLIIFNYFYKQYCTFGFLQCYRGESEC